MKRLPLTFCVLILLLAAPVSAAADCPALVQQALTVTDSMCQTTGKNQACYGNMRLQAKPIPQVPVFTFDRPGDRVDLRDIKSLQLSPMTVDTGEWGIVLMHIQANLPATSNQNVILLAFGDVAIENKALLPTATDVQVIGKDAVNVRWLPNIKAGAVAVLQPGQQVTAIERLVDSSWLRIELPNSGETGWVNRDLVKGLGDINRLNVTQGDQPNYRPMQAFTFNSGTTQQNCDAIPKDGLLIQTPEGAGEIRLWINQVMVKMGSTVYFRAQSGGEMVISTLEGHATVEALGVSHTAVAGTSVRVKLDANMKPAAAPSLPEAYPIEDVLNLPIGNLQREIAIHAPLTAEAVALVQQQQQAQTTVSSEPEAAASESDTTGCAGGNCNHTTVNNDPVQVVVNNVVDTGRGSGDSAANTPVINDGSGAGDSSGGNTGGNEPVSGGNTSGSNTGGDNGGGLLDTILHLPCLLLPCK